MAVDFPPSGIHDKIFLFHQRLKLLAPAAKRK
jgi:hypothetical protein